MRRKEYDPFFDRGLRGWMVDYAKSQHWRVAGWIDLDDMIGEGMLAYAICRSRYADKVQNQAHFMSLYKRVFMGMVHNMATKRTRLEAAGLTEVAISQVAVDGRELDALELLGGAIMGDAELTATLAHAPEEVRRLMELMRSGALQRGFKHRKLADGKRENTNQLLNRVLGLSGDSFVDFEAELRAFIY